jgi:hypothetical protein
VVLSSRILELIDVDRVIPVDSTVLVNSPVRLGWGVGLYIVLMLLVSLLSLALL